MIFASLKTGSDFRLTKEELQRQLNDLDKLSVGELVKTRIDKFCAMGAYADAAAAVGELQTSK